MDYRRQVPIGPGLSQTVQITAEVGVGGQPGRVGLQCDLQAPPLWLTPEATQDLRRYLAEAFAVAMRDVRW